LTITVAGEEVEPNEVLLPVKEKLPTRSTRIISSLVIPLRYVLGSIAKP
jgi:hypothetical protein